MSALRWQCHACGLLHPSWAAAEHHARAERHVRVELVQVTS